MLNQNAELRVPNSCAINTNFLLSIIPNEGIAPTADWRDILESKFQKGFHGICACESPRRANVKITEVFPFTEGDIYKETRPSRILTNIIVYSIKVYSEKVKHPVDSSKEGQLNRGCKVVNHDDVWNDSKCQELLNQLQGSLPNEAHLLALKLSTQNEYLIGGAYMKYNYLIPLTRNEQRLCQIGDLHVVDACSSGEGGNARDSDNPKLDQTLLSLACSLLNKYGCNDPSDEMDPSSCRTPKRTNIALSSINLRCKNKIRVHKDLSYLQVTIAGDRLPISLSTLLLEKVLQVAAKKVYYLEAAGYLESLAKRTLHALSLESCDNHVCYYFQTIIKHSKKNAVPTFTTKTDRQPNIDKLEAALKRVYLQVLTDETNYEAFQKWFKDNAPKSLYYGYAVSKLKGSASSTKKCRSKPEGGTPHCSYESESVVYNLYSDSNSAPSSTSEYPNLLQDSIETFIDTRETIASENGNGWLVHKAVSYGHTELLEKLVYTKPDSGASDASAAAPALTTKSVFPVFQIFHLFRAILCLFLRIATTILKRLRSFSTLTNWSFPRQKLCASFKVIWQRLKEKLD